MALPINVGLMFFNESPDDFFPYAQIEVVIKPDPTGTLVPRTLTKRLQSLYEKLTIGQ